MKRSVSELGLTFEPHILVFRDMTFVKKHKSLFVKKHDKGKRSLQLRLKLLNWRFLFGPGAFVY